MTMLRALKKAVRRVLPRRVHPLLDKPIELRGRDASFADAYAAELLHDRYGDLPFAQERYREGIRWRQVIEAVAPRARRIVDVGAGNGAVALAMAAAGDRAVIAVDMLVNDTMRRLMALAPRGIHIAGDGLALPLANESVDVVLCLETIEHIPQQSLRGFADEMARVLRPDGIILMTTPPRWRYLLRGDPHFGIRGLLMLPPAAQRAIAARRGFGEAHHYVGQIYSSARQIGAAFPGFDVEVLSRSRAPRRWFWDALILRRQARA
jgi:SAM-dependent methyltransferase